MYLKYQAKALYRLFGKRTFFFDHKSYDNLEDIPHIFLNGKRIDVYSVHFVYGGTAIFCELKDNVLSEITIKLVNEKMTDDDFDEILISYGFDTLFHDMYYESEESYEIGDYELDFLGLYPENLKGYEGLSKNEMLTDIANTIKNTGNSAWSFPPETFILLNLWGSSIRTELKFITIRENSRSEGGVIVELNSIDDEREEEEYTDNLEDFSIEEIRRIYAIFKTIS